MTVTIPKWWPNRSNSEFIKSENYNWHIQKFGSTGKKLLLIHGTGASSHSWYPLIENLNLDFETLCLDLPGHGFTRAFAKQNKPRGKDGIRERFGQQSKRRTNRMGRNLDSRTQSDVPIL